MIQATRHDAVGVDAVELDESTALDRTPHLQAEAREAQEDRQQDEHDHGDRDGGQVDPVDRRAPRW